MEHMQSIAENLWDSTSLSVAKSVGHGVELYMLLASFALIKHSKQCY